MSGGHHILELGRDDVERVAPLFMQLIEFHREVVEGAWPGRSAEEARGAGIGTMLIEACRERLREQGVRYWAVAVVEDNADATRLYERVGFRPFYRQLLAEV